MGKSLEDLNFVVAHLGGGISICPVKSGKMIDVNNASEMGPFSPERTGGLPVGGFSWDVLFWEIHLRRYENEIKRQWWTYVLFRYHRCKGSGRIE